LNTVILLPKDLRYERGGTKLVYCPGPHLTSLCLCLAYERSCSVTMSDHRVMSQYHSFAIVHGGAGVTRPTYYILA